ncbi:MAG: hypothetical protein WCT04_11315 [Planctomycetota bacterium]
MTIRLQTLAVAVVSSVLAVSGLHAAETPYYKSVSDVEVETSVKGVTYDASTDKSPSPGIFGRSSSKNCPCVCETATVSAATPSAEKPVAVAAVASDLNDRLKIAIAQLSTASWQDAQTLLTQSGKASVPFLIEALSSSDAAYNLGGHTKADAGRLPRQRTVAEVAAELLTDIVTNHTSFKGEVPGADQAAWREWWTKNAEGVTFASN